MISCVCAGGKVCFIIFLPVGAHTLCHGHIDTCSFSDTFFFPEESRTQYPKCIQYLPANAQFATVSVKVHIYLSSSQYTNADTFLMMPMPKQHVLTSHLSQK